MVDVGRGAPLVLIPGIQGRWEWMKPSVDALARTCRVITDSLPGEPGVRTAFDEEAGFDLFVQHVDGMLDAAGLADAVICGVSFGGLIALHYAATRRHRVRALILVSTPGPRWKLTPRLARYANWPMLSSPFFALGAIRRGWLELRVVHPDLRARLHASLQAAWRVVRAPAAPYRMSRRARLGERQDFESDCAKVTVPTLVVTGEHELDRVVPCDETMRYLSLIPGARFQRLERTGHLGTVLAPERFASMVSGFVND
jgi:3-oxoadipate enol-lactonase